VRHFIYRPAVAPAEVEGHLNRWLFARRAKGLARLDSARPVYYPFWRRMRGSRVELVPAAASPEGPLDEIRSPSGELRPYDPDLRLEASLVPAASPPPDGEPGEAGAWLVHVPVYHAVYELGGRRAVALVEGTSGRIIASTAPAGVVSGQRVRDTFVIWASVVGLVLAATLIPDGWWALGAWAVVGAVTYVLLAHGGGGARS
jgi:hypothetical protein